MKDNNIGIKILFLDIDGCLNHQEFYKNRSNNKIVQDLPYPLNEFDPVCVSLINDILDKTKSKLVLSSDWRFTEGIENIFKAVGFKHKIYSITPYGMGKKRGEEIKTWLEQHSNINIYCIIDDLPKEHFLKEQYPYFVKINPNNGITIENCNKIISILNNYEFIKRNNH